MKQRLADYVADFLAARGVTDVFSVVGGGAMHLNDALGHNPRLHVTYNHQEQARAIAAAAAHCSGAPPLRWQSAAAAIALAAPTSA